MRSISGLMRGYAPKHVVEISHDDRVLLEKLSRKRTAPYCEVVRAKGLLMAADGARNVEIAARLGVTRRDITVWRKDFRERGVACLRDRKRSGRKRHFSP
jgi:transposase